MAGIIAAFFLGTGIGFFASWVAQENLLNRTWLICQNCKYKRKAEEGSIKCEKEKLFQKEQP